MRRTPSLLLIAFVAWPLTLHAEVYKWKDPSTGKMILSDTPQPGTSTARRGRIETEVPATPAEAAKPATPAATGSVDPELEKRRKTQEAKEKAEADAQQAKREDALHRNCSSARQNLISLKSGERIALRDDKGERYFMEDGPRQAEIKRIEGFLAEQCAGK